MSKSATAFITVKVKVPNSGGNWGDDWTLGAMRKQARESCLKYLAKTLDGSGIKIVGEAEVTAVHYDLDK